MEKITQFLIDTVKEASKIIDENFEVKAKDEFGDIVTNCDLAVEKFIIDKIKKEYPTFGIVSEETNTKNKLSENCFVFDPIDGTVNFANNIPLWGIQIACIMAGKTCSAVIFLPKFGELYYADRSGAFCNDKPISVCKKPILNSICCVDGKSRMPNIVRLKKHTSYARSYGSCAVNFAWMAGGKLGAAVFKGTTVWDYVPGCFIAEKAGAVVYHDEQTHLVASSKEIAEIAIECCKHYENDFAFTSNDKK